MGFSGGGSAAVKEFGEGYPYSLPPRCHKKGGAGLGGGSRRLGQAHSCEFILSTILIPRVGLISQMIWPSPPHFLHFGLIGLSPATRGVAQ